MEPTSGLIARGSVVQHGLAWHFELMQNRIKTGPKKFKIKTASTTHRDVVAASHSLATQESSCLHVLACETKASD